MAVVEATTQYIIIMISTLIFTVLALTENEQNQKTITLQYFAGTFWLISAFAHFIVGDTTSTLTYALTYLFIGFGFIFFIAAFYNSFNLIQTKRKRSREQI